MNNDYFSLLRTAWHYARSEKRTYIIVYILFALANVSQSIYPIIFGNFVNQVQADSTKIWNSLLIYIGIYLFLKIFEWVFHGPARILERTLAFNLSQNFLQEKYHQVLHLPAAWHTDNHSGATINRIRKSYEALKDFFENGFMYFATFAKFFIALFAMVYFSPLFGGIGLLLGLFTIRVLFWFDVPYIKTLDEVNEAEHQVSATLFDSIANIRTVITLRLEKSMENGLYQKVRAIFPAYKKNMYINEWKWFAADILVASIYAIVALGYVYQNYNSGKPVAVGNLIVLLGFVNQFTSVFHDVAWQYTNIIQFNTNVNASKDITESYNALNKTSTSAELPVNWKNIDINDLNFSYHTEYNNERKAQSLHGIHLNLKRGARIAIIGESGGGKSTVLALLRGLYAPEQSTKLTVDEKPIDNWNILGNTVTLFPQEPEIFDNTIEHNLTLGLPYNEKTVDAACEIANVTEIIAQLPNGKSSHIQEKGVNLSGGQKQRLALARGILAAQESTIVLLDEPTSSVDAKTEYAIYKNLLAAFKDKTVISTLHRLHLLVFFDYVYIMKQGRIIDEGTFLNLKEKSPTFKELWKHQEIIMQTEV